ncbi:MAG: phosphocholine cytidylyltransferase family protein [Patescibacteria group bacterium]
MKAIILAAGESKRLYPLTLDKPKSLLPIEDKTILDHQVESLVAVGIEELILVVGYHKQLIVDHLKEKGYPIRITYIENEQYRTTGPILGGLALVKEYFQEPVIFFHCDVLFETDALTRLLADPRDSVMLYRAGAWDEEAGKIVVDPQTSRVLECGKHIEQERASGEYLQIAKFGASFGAALVDTIELRGTTGNDGFTIDAFNDVVRAGEIEAYGLPFDALTSEIDTPEDYEAAKRAWKERI